MSESQQGPEIWSLVQSAISRGIRANRNEGLKKHGVEKSRLMILLFKDVCMSYNDWRRDVYAIFISLFLLFLKQRKI